MLTSFGDASDVFRAEWWYESNWQPPYNYGKLGAHQGQLQCNISHQNLSELKSREISFAHNLFVVSAIILKFCTEHGNDTAVLGAKILND